MMNPLKTKRVCYIRTQSIPRNKHSPTRLYKTSLLTLYEVKVALCSAVLTQHTTQCEYHVEFLNVKIGGT